MKEYYLPAGLATLGLISGIYLNKGIAAYNEEIKGLEQYLNITKTNYVINEKSIENHPLVTDVRQFVEKGVGIAQDKLGIKQQIIENQGYELSTGMARQEIPEFHLTKIPEHELLYPFLTTSLFATYGYLKVLGTIKRKKREAKILLRIKKLENESRR